MCVWGELIDILRGTLGQAQVEDNACTGVCTGVGEQFTLRQIDWVQTSILN